MNKPTKTEAPGAAQSLRPLIIYKTRKNYDGLVPVTLSDDGKTIAAYPHPKDLKIGEGLALPLRLNDGFLLDRRGVSVRTAFTSFDYETYAERPEPPPHDSLFKAVIDADPFLEMYDMGPAHTYKNPVQEINQIIEDDKLKEYKKLK